MADEVVKQVQRKSCAFFLKRKNRYCKMTVGEGRTFCGEHMIVAGEPETGGRKRIPCPLDKNHTVFEDQLKRHLKKCNQTKKRLVVYYKCNINSGILNYDFSPLEKIPLSSVAQEKITSLIEKIKRCCKVHVPKVPEEFLTHAVFKEELSEMKDNPVTLKHLKQQASIIGHMERLHLLEPNSVFLEFGAGRGKLSHWLQKAIGNSAENVDFLLIDRASNRYKYDRYHRGEEQGPSFQRLNLDIEHLDLSKVPAVENRSRKIVAFSKHLCGSATDLTLRCLLETLVDSQECSRQNTFNESDSDSRETKRVKLESREGSVRGIILALCCHHRCSWPQYVGRPFMEKLGFTAEDFHLLCCLSSWTTCGIRLKKRTNETYHDSEYDVDGESDGEEDIQSAEETLNKEQNQPANDVRVSGHSQDNEEDRWSNFTVSERQLIGWQCKRLIDAGRLWFLKARDFDSNLASYVDSSVSLENTVLIATPIA